MAPTQSLGCKATSGGTHSPPQTSQECTSLLLKAQFPGTPGTSAVTHPVPKVPGVSRGEGRTPCGELSRAAVRAQAFRVFPITGIGTGCGSAPRGAQPGLEHSDESHGHLGSLHAQGPGTSCANCRPAPKPPGDIAPLASSSPTPANTGTQAAGV